MKESRATGRLRLLRQFEIRLKRVTFVTHKLVWELPPWPNMDGALFTQVKCIQAALVSVVW